MGGASPAQIARTEIAMARRFAHDETLALFGPDHPQAPPQERTRSDSAASQ